MLRWPQQNSLVIMKKAYQAPKTQVHSTQLYDNLCEVIYPTGPGDDFTNERNDQTDAQGEQIWDKEW